MMPIVAGWIPKACVHILYKSNPASSSFMSPQSTHLTVQGHVKEFVSVVYNSSDSFWSIFPHWEFFIALIIDDDGV